MSILTGLTGTEISKLHVSQSVSKDRSITVYYNLNSCRPCLILKEVHCINRFISLCQEDKVRVLVHYPLVQYTDCPTFFETRCVKTWH